MSAQKLYPAGHSIQYLFPGVLALTFSGGAAASNHALVAPKSDEGESQAKAGPGYCKPTALSDDARTAIINIKNRF
jgi:hypothetical protein